MVYTATFDIYKVTNTTTNQVDFYVNPNALLLDLIRVNPMVKLEVYTEFYPDLSLLEYREVSTYV